MRNIVIGLVLSVMIILSISIVYTIDSRSVRSQEAEYALDNAVEGTIGELKENVYTIDDEDQFIADMIEILAVQIESDSTITVNVLDADYEKGLLSVEVVESYKHPNGNTGTVSCIKTVILEQQQDEDEESTEDMVTLTYVIISENETEEVYKKYTVEKGTEIIIPSDPEMEGATFTGWQIDNEQFIFFDEIGEKCKVNEDIVLTAKFE